ncbi:MAG: hypothetical protein IKX28_06965 [Bacteroidales bacterium]|nr:hypothetical protein [Bacteroidales bacterium]
MIHIRHILLALSALVLLCGCSDKRMRVAFSESEEIRLMVGGTVPFTFDPNTCQLAFSRDRKEFRAHTDNMSDFYAVRFTEIPSTLGQTVTADLTWTTERDVLTRKNLTLEVVRIEGDQFWLWSNSGRIGLSIRVLE